MDDQAPHSTSVLPRWDKLILPALFSLGVLIWAFVVLRRCTERVTLTLIIQSLDDIPLSAIVIAVVATFISFTAMSANEFIAVRVLGKTKVRWQTAVLAGAIGNALSNTLGFHALTISAWRYRIYRPLGMTKEDVASITGIAFFEVLLGFTATAALTLLLHIREENLRGSLDAFGRLAISCLLLCGLTAFLLWLRHKPRELKLRRWSVKLPSFIQGASQLTLGLIDTSAAIYAAYMLLPLSASDSFPQFAIIYIVAVLFGIASHAPGGIGVFEASIISGLGQTDPKRLLAALLAYRLLYNLLPFFLAAAGAALHALFHKRQLENG